MPVSAEEKSSKSERLNPAPYLRIMQLIDEKYPSMFDVLVKAENYFASLFYGYFYVQIKVKYILTSNV
jgi:hypothetical protein